MDLNTILRFFVIISCCSLIIRVLIAKNNWGWFSVAIAILGVTFSSPLLIPEKSGIIGGIFWLIFVLIPIVGLRQVNHWIYQEKFQQARKLASWLSWLHPADGWREQPKFLRVLELTKKGDLETAQEILNQSLQNPTHGFQSSARAIQFRMEAQWENCLQWFKDKISDSQLWHNSTLATVYLRTLGEVGDLNRLIETVQSHQTQLQILNSGITVNLARLYVFAFAGEVKAVEKLFASTLKKHPKNKQKFWLATAEIAAGNPETGQKILFNIQDKDLTLEAAIRSRLDQPCPEAKSILTPESQSIITTIKQNLQEEINYGTAIRLAPTKAHTTYSLIVINILVFLLEIQQGGSQNLETLYQLGAAVPNEIIAGEPWRIFTANFLHYGFIHLASNLLGLWILGPYVEFFLGTIRYLIIYFLSGMGAISIFTGVALQTGQGNEVLLGASAAIMGLMGANFIILWRGWQRDQSKIAKERLQLVLLIIGLQIIFDLNVPNVSFLGHFFGLIFGILTTGILLSLIHEKNQQNLS